ncbi:MAG TPA: glycosyltransferase family 39 protein [Vicinamibacterales bacterium]|nr:glycosyltransferase family 39 protein [Vicinamibacterales bacterium]
MFGFRSPRQILLAVLLLAAAIPFLVNLGVSSIWDANEAFYAQTPREMIEAGDYVTPSFNFQLRMNKPVLSYWNVAASYHLFGISEWSERLPIALGGLAIVATAFGLGRLLGGTTAGLLSALVLATSPRLLLLARRIIIDVHITMWTGLVLLCFALTEVRPQQRRVYLALMYVSAGFGVLTKGPVAVFIPAVVFFIYLASQKRLRDLRHMMLPAGALISLSIVVPWYYLLYREHGWEYIGAFIFGENLGRFAEAVGEQSRGVLFYLPVMLADLFPWSFLIPVALWWAVQEKFQDRVARLLVIWVATVVAFFSMSGTKEDLYILPIVAAEAALIGAMLASALEGATVARPASWLTGASALLLLVAGSVLIWVFAISQRYSLSGATFIGAVALAGGGVALVMTLRRQLFGAVAVLASAVVLVTWCVVLCTLPDFERYKPVRPFAGVIRTRASIGAIVGSYKFSLPSMVFYLQRPIMEVVLPDHLRAVFHSSSDIYFIMPESEYESVKDRLPVQTYILARQQMFDLKPRNFLQGSELPQFVLVSNRE